MTTVPLSLSRITLWPALLAATANLLPAQSPVQMSDISLDFGSQLVGTTNRYTTVRVGSANLSGIGVGDVNGDGNADLVVAGGFSNSVYILLGNGDGTFRTAVGYPTGGSYPNGSVIVADLNGDGEPDIAVANQNNAGSGVSVLINDGTGAFRTAVLYPVGGAFSLAAADFNRDGKLDLAVGGYTSSPVFLNNGDGTFTAAPPSPNGIFGPNPVAAGDLNGDGNPDLAMGGYAWFGNGDGTFSSGVVYSQSAFWPSIGDFNGDGKPDLVGSIRRNDPTFTGAVLALGNGDGTFQPPVERSAGAAWQWASTAADLRGIGVSDAVITDDLSPVVSVLLGQRAGALARRTNYGPLNTGLGSPVVVADFNKDGIPDVAVPSSADVAILLGKGDGTFVAPRMVILMNVSSTPVSVTGVAIAGENASEFSIYYNGCGGSIYYNSVRQCGLAVIFNPASAGPKSATLTIADSAGGQFSVALSGIGAAADSTPPTITCGSPDGLWHASDVVISCSSTDRQSGLANPADANFTLFTSVTTGTETSDASTGSRQVCDLAGNCATAGPIGGNKVDKKAPVITIASPQVGSYLLNQPVTATYSCSDAGSGVAKCGGPVPSGGSVSTSVAGAITFDVSSADAVGNAAGARVDYQVRYAASGACAGDAGHQILPPIAAAGTSVFKQGSTVPAKFRVCDAAGVSVGTAGVVSAFSLVSAANGTATDTVNAPVDSSTPDSTFRWDSANQQWIFNISTQNLSAGYTYVFRIALNDGSSIEFRFGLR